MASSRESRRILAEYKLVEEDVLTGRKFSDGICRCSYYMDTHDGRKKTPEYKKSLAPPEGDFFEVPYRCLIPKGVDRLLLACRALSVTFDAHMELRMQNDLQRIGEAAGVAAVFGPGTNIPASAREVLDLIAARRPGS